MSILSVQAVGRRFRDRVLFADVSFRLAQSDRVGLVGPNGAGKTTLLRMAAGLATPDAGGVALARGTRVGFLQQELLVDVPGIVEDHARGAARHLHELENELRALEARLGDADAQTVERYADLQHRFEHAGGYDFEGTLRRVLGGLGLDPLRRREVSTLSGGERTRLGLARLLLDDPDLLLLDEPTNHLDVAALEWLERFLLDQDATVLVTSHDRWFLDRVTSRTLAFEGVGSEEGAYVTEYKGPYSRYAAQRAEREAALAKAAEKQSTEIAREQAFVDRYRAGQRAKQARGRATRLARLERIEAPARGLAHRWRLEAAHLAGATVLEATDLVAGYPGREVALAGRLRVSRGSRIAVVGPNGSGKTTLVRTLVGDLPALGGFVTSAPTARVALLAQAQSELTGSETVLESLRGATGLGEQEARGLLARFLFRGEEVFRPVGALSGGERSRLALARLSAREANLLVLDEPTNHLDLAAREQLERVLAEYEGTMIVVSHDRYFIDKLATSLWRVENGTVSTFEGTWSSLQREIAAGKAPWETTTRPDEVRAAPSDGRSAASGAPTPGDARASRAGRGSPKPRAAPSRRAAEDAKRIAELEARIKDLEAKMKALEERLAAVAQSGDYLETKRVGEEHAELEASLRALYEEWAAGEERQ